MRGEKMKRRFSFHIDENLKDWLQIEADRYGISQGALINIAISQYKEQREVMLTMSNLDTIMKKLEDLKK